MAHLKTRWTKVEISKVNAHIIRGIFGRIDAPDYYVAKVEVDGVRRAGLDGLGKTRKAALRDANKNMAADGVRVG